MRNTTRDSISRIERLEGSAARAPSPAVDERDIGRAG
jgi:hypothetical protein